MKITNKLNLPSQLVSVVDNNYKPTPKQYSCTTILKPTRQIILERRYGDLIEQDVSDMAWMIFGIAVHSIIENSKEDEGQFKEEKLKEELGLICEDLLGYKLSGRSDLIDLTNKEIVDWKTCSAWKIIYNDFDDWKREMLIYGWLVKKLGFDIDKAKAVAFIKDHNKSKAKQESGYPQLPIYVKEFSFTDEDYEDIEEYIITKFREIKDNEEVSDMNLPMCTLEERWNKGNTYAVKKIKNKTATKVHETLEDAESHLKNLEYQYPGEYEIETRLGEDTRCLNYCSCCHQCPYYIEKYDKDYIDMQKEIVEESEKNRIELMEGNN